MKEPLKIPFDKYGMQARPHKCVLGFHWVDNFAFYSTLLITHYQRGGGSIKLVLKDSSGTSYKMFPTDMLDMLQKMTIIDGRVTGEWTFCKRGTNYGIKMVST